MAKFEEYEETETRRSSSGKVLGYSLALIIHGLLLLMVVVFAEPLGKIVRGDETQQVLKTLKIDFVELANFFENRQNGETSGPTTLTIDRNGQVLTASSSAQDGSCTKTKNGDFLIVADTVNINNGPTAEDPSQALADKLDDLAKGQGLDEGLGDKPNIIVTIQSPEKPEMAKEQPAAGTLADQGEGGDKPEKTAAAKGKTAPTAANKKPVAKVEPKAQIATPTEQAKTAAKKPAAKTAPPTTPEDDLLAGKSQPRSAKRLEQLPNNPLPYYSVEDRFLGKEGLVIFLGYVVESGVLTRLELKKTSGHQSLDRRTLQALKKWRFKPGQEGWVELPFLWQLEGEPVELQDVLLEQRTTISKLN